MKYFRRKIHLLQQSFLIALLAIGLFLALPVLILAAPGDLDPTFGNGGKVITASLGAIWDLAIQPDGKIVAVSDVGIFRYNANGSLDSSLGGLNYRAVAIQADGKIVAAGVAYSSKTDPGSAIVARHHPNGTLDTTFNGTGTIITPVGTHGGLASGIAIQTDGKIVVAGYGRNGTNFHSVVFRYHSNGTPDKSFNGTGSVTTPNSHASSVAIQPDGKIAVSSSDGSQFAIFRYNANGSPDTSFGGTGTVTTTIEGYSSGGAHHLAIQSDGKIVAKGVIGNENKNVALIIRHNINGSLDTTFGNNGAVFEPYNVSNEFAGDVAIQPDGKIVTVGSIANAVIMYDFGVARYNPNGSLDTTFGEGGIVTTNVWALDFPDAVAIQADGKIVAAGSTSDTVDHNGALARYQGGSRTRFDFDGDGRADISVFRPSDRVWYLLRSGSGFTAAQFGISTDKITPADFDGDGKTDITVFRDGVWYWLNSSNGNFNAYQFGIASDIPVPADYTGDGRAELAVYRFGVWYTLNLGNNQFQAAQFGIASDKPVPADFDADGKIDFAVYRDGTWYMLRSTAGFTAMQFGIASDKPTVGDFDGDGKADQAVYRSGVWYVPGSTRGFFAVQFGITSDIPVAADYDGDGKTDIAVYRDGVWYWLQSSNNQFRAVQFGIANDSPIPAAFAP